MPSNQKQIHVQTFTNGVDTDTAPELLKPDTSVYMLNCIAMSTSSGDMGVVTNPKGNVLIETNLPAGRNRTIGTAKDEEKNKFYYFVWNQNGYHTIYMYDGLLNKITIVMQSITDTGGVDIFGWQENDLVLMADVVRNTLLYWVKAGNDAAKINIEKCLDKTDTGYGSVISAEIVNAYKLAPIAAPVATYFSDTTVNVNRLYGTLTKYASRYIYDDGEISNWSDYSNAPVPPKEAFTGVNFIPTDNNGINIIVTTGSMIVEKIEIAMLYTLDGGYSSWVLIATLDKDKLQIGDNSEYTYKFYNDGSYTPVDQEKIIRPYSFLPKAPLLQAFTRKNMVYGNFYEGFPDVPIQMSFDDIIYEPLFLEDDIESELNNPKILIEFITDDYIYKNEPVLRVDGSFAVLSTSKATRARKFKLTIGADVKGGNKFNTRFYNGFDDYGPTYTATITDTATTVANKLKQILISTGRILKASPDIPVTDIYANTNTGGDISFEFIMYATPDKQYLDSSYSVNPVNTSSLKDTGQSIPNMKLGAATKYGIVYEDFEGRRSLVYTDVNLIIKTDTQNTLGDMKSVKLVLNINHKPPVWARRFQIVRTADLTYGNFIQMVIQKVIDVISTDNDNGEYLDLLIGSLYTYQQIHPNTTLKYQFNKGDRIRFISKEDGSYYDFFEAEILAYNAEVVSDINQNVSTAGTAIVTVDQTSADNVGKFIVIDGNEREIVEATSATTYTLNAPIGSSTAATYLSYTLIDRRGSIRIRKPAIEIEDISLVEIFTPSASTDLTNKQFFHFNKKFDIKDAGLDTRVHFGDIQTQTDLLPAKISITEGTIYVRSREMPITNNKPAQVVIRTIEDPQYSDFYFSLMNGNGKTNIEDTGVGVVHFGSRLRYSNNYIEDTKINGLNDFDNTDREDYNDKYGDIKLIVYTENQLLTFKELKDCIIPVFQTVIQDNEGQELLGLSTKLLNEIRYYSHKGGIGDNPESYSSNASQHYHVSVNSGAVLRLGGDGLTPISEIYYFDRVMSAELAEAYKNGAQIYTEWDIDINALIVSISDYASYTYNGNFSEANWKVLSDAPPADSPIEILTNPANGTVMLDGTFAVVTEDYLGKDSFLYRIFVNGSWVTKKVCLEYTELPNRQKAWRPRYSDAVCELEEGENTGNLIFVTLEEYYIDDNSATGDTKPNVITDPDYAPPIVDITTCPIEGEIFYNIEYTTSATKNDCPSGQTGSVVSYTVPAAMFSSVVSQEAADNKAINYANTNKQANANSLGTCTPASTFGNDIQSQSFQRNNCGGGQVGTFVTYTVPANTYYRTSKALANAAAQAEITANGQSNANTNGTCYVPSTFQFQVVIYSNYTNAKYDTTDSRGKSFEFSDGGVIKSAILVNTLVTRNNTIYTFNVPFSGASVTLSAIRCFLQLNATSVVGNVTQTAYKNGSYVGQVTTSRPAGQPSGTQYETFLVFAAPFTFTSSDILRLEHGSSPTTTFYNTEITVYATRNNCAEGQVGSSVPLVVPAGLFSSTVDQDAADAQALAYANANKQSNANTYGTCSTPITYYSVEKSGTATRNNCPVGQVGSLVTYTVPAGTYTSIISQSDADAQAQADVDANKQQYANDNGTCTISPVMKVANFQNLDPDVPVMSVLVVKIDGAVAVPLTPTFNYNNDYEIFVADGEAGSANYVTHTIGQFKFILSSVTYYASSITRSLDVETGSAFYDNPTTVFLSIENSVVMANIELDSFNNCVTNPLAIGEKNQVRLVDQQGVKFEEVGQPPFTQNGVKKYYGNQRLIMISSVTRAFTADVDLNGTTYSINANYYDSSPSWEAWMGFQLVPDTIGLSIVFNVTITDCDANNISFVLENQVDSYASVKEIDFLDGGNIVYSSPINAGNTTSPVIVPINGTSTSTVMIFDITPTFTGNRRYTAKIYVNTILVSTQNIDISSSPTENFIINSGLTITNGDAMRLVLSSIPENKIQMYVRGFFEAMPGDFFLSVQNESQFAFTSDIFVNLRITGDTTGTSRTFSYNFANGNHPNFADTSFVSRKTLITPDGYSQTETFTITEIEVFPSSDANYYYTGEPFID